MFESHLHLHRGQVWGGPGMHWNVLPCTRGSFGDDSLILFFSGTGKLIGILLMSRFLFGLARASAIAASIGNATRDTCRIVVDPPKKRIRQSAGSRRQQNLPPAMPLLPLFLVIPLKGGAAMRRSIVLSFTGFFFFLLIFFFMENVHVSLECMWGVRTESTKITMYVCGTYVYLS